MRMPRQLFKFLLASCAIMMRPLPLPYPVAAERLHSPTAFGALVGAIRVVMTLVLIVVGLVVLLSAALIPGRPGGARWSMWVSVGISRLFLLLSGIRLRQRHAEALRAHRGFVFFNHVSYLDVVVVLACRPVRFLAASGVRRLPAIGWMARAVGTVFVNRGADASREKARDGLRQAFDRSPTPIALAPEGGVRHGPYVSPFRHGAFEVAADAGGEILLVALDFEPRGRAAWLPGESLIRAYWRVAAHTRPLTAHVVAILPAAAVTTPAPEAASEAEQRINAALDGLWRARSSVA